MAAKLAAISKLHSSLDTHEKSSANSCINLSQLATVQTEVAQAAEDNESTTRRSNRNFMGLSEQPP
jgi:hypothetical protein